MSDTWRTLGFDGDMQAVLALAPQAITDATPVLSAAINLSSASPDYRRTRVLAVFMVKETTPTAHTIDFTVTESATSGGVYTAAETSGTVTTLSADGIQFCSIKRNKAKPFIKITATGSHADIDVIVAAGVLFLNDAI